MAAAETLTWDLATPRRPSLDDVGGAGLIDHATRPPIAVRMITADAGNQWQEQIQRLAGMVPVASFSVRFSAGTPSIYKFVAMPTAPITGTFTVTDNGPGDTTISWPAGTFPTSALEPKASLNGGSGVLAPVATMVTNGVQVVTSDGLPVDAAFTVDVF